MSEAKRVRLRPLPAGEFREGVEVGWQNRVLDVDLVDDTTAAGLEPGVAVEVESQSGIYFGVLQDRRMAGVSIVVEHSLERSQIESIQELWG